MGNVRNIRYILAVVREVLRVHPPAISAIKKQLGNDNDVLPGGRDIPARTNIALSVTTILQDLKTFVANEELLRPERRLEDIDEEPRKKMDRAHKLILSSVRLSWERNCDDAHRENLG
jgi:cytochrome P450